MPGKPTERYDSPQHSTKAFGVLLWNIGSSIELDKFVPSKQDSACSYWYHPFW
jgi:hypothetical protein